MEPSATPADVTLLRSQLRRLQAEKQASEGLSEALQCGNVNGPLSSSVSEAATAALSCAFPSEPQSVNMFMVSLAAAAFGG
jgi:hypothetical protein